jgi:DNA-binding CsgD family transcriptional regulator
MPTRESYRISVRNRFFFYTLVFLGLVSLCLAVVLPLPGGLSARNMAVLLSKERNHLAQNLTRQFGEASAQAMSLSRELSASVGRKLREHRISISGLSGKPDILTEILGGEVGRLLFSLEKTKFGGVFVTLDATVNPGVEGAINSRAGLYIRNIDRGFMERNADQLFLRGPTQIALAEGFTLQTRWALEFDVKDQPFWERPREALEENSSLPLSRLFYWYFSDTFAGLGENMAVCSVPLLDEERRFLGVCGFEIGERKFERDNVLDTNNTPNIAGLFFEFFDPGEKQFRPSQALFTGNATLGDGLSKLEELSIGGNFYGLEGFRYGDNNACVGFWNEIDIYPDASPFAGQRFAAAVVVPRKDFEEIVSAARLRLILTIMVLLCIGIALSLFLSRRYAKPFKELLESLKAGDMSAKSHIQEIDDLLEFMRAQLALREKNGENEERETSGSREKNEGNREETSGEAIGSRNDLLDSFIANTKTLSRAEADVFNLYLDGHTAQEIAALLSLSLNTIKSHNRRIFAKLNVSSRKELLTWIQVLSASGRSLDDSRQKQFDKIRSIVKSMKDTPVGGE